MRIINKMASTAETTATDTITQGMNDSYIEVLSADGTRKAKVNVDEYLHTKKITMQFDLIPNVVVGYLGHMLVLFAHCIIVFNMTEPRTKQIMLTDREKMINWVLVTMFVYWFMKDA